MTLMLVSIDCVVHILWVFEIMAHHDWVKEPKLCCVAGSIVWMKRMDILLKVEEAVAMPYRSHLVRLCVHSSLYVSGTREDWDGGAEARDTGCRLQGRCRHAVTLLGKSLRTYRPPQHPA
jgi:hypothetical protein